MTDEAADALVERKAGLRRRAYDARNAQENKDEVSRTIVERFMALPEYAAADTAMWYLDVRSEVRTRHQLGDALTAGKRIIVPYCTVDESANKLGLWHLTRMDELVVGKWKILEPPRERWGEAGKEAEPRDLDLVMVPGVGFARDGARMGNGQGYYDRLLDQVRPDAPLIALAYVDRALDAATGNGSSTILCDCEAGLDRYVGPGGDESFATPDGRPGAIVQLHVPRFRKDRVAALERSLLVRISQNVLTCPTAACFNLLDTDPYYKLGRKIAYFGDGYQFRAVRYGRRVWVIPILGGEFVVDRRFGYREGLMGGNIWYFGKDVDSALAAAERGAGAIEKIPGVIMSFPGGIAASGSKAGSRYSFIVASTYERFCPTLREKLGEKSGLPEGVGSVMEIIVDGRDLQSIIDATQAAIAASLETPDLVRISAGNYGGRLGKSFIHLHPDKQPPRD